MDLGGSAENQGDLKSVVLHKMTLAAHKSTFPVALGIRVPGVDDATFSSTGEPYSTIVLPQSETSTGKVLQADDVSLGAQQSMPRIRHPHPLLPLVHALCFRAQPTSFRRR